MDFEMRVCHCPPLKTAPVNKIVNQHLGIWAGESKVFRLNVGHFIPVYAVGYINWQTNHPNPMGPPRVRQIFDLS